MSTNTSTSNPSARRGKERVLVPSRLSNRLAGKWAEPLPLPSARKINTSAKKNLGATPRKLQRIPGEFKNSRSGDERALSESSLCNPQDFSKKIGETLNPTFDKRMEPFCHQTGYASEQGGRSLYQSIKSNSNREGGPSSVNFLSASLLRAWKDFQSKKDEQKGIQKFNLFRNVPDGTSTPINLAVPGPTEEGPGQKEPEQPKSTVIDSKKYVTKEFFCKTLDNLFLSLEKVIDKNNVSTENKISEQVQYFKDLSINQTSALDMIGEVTD